MDLPGAPAETLFMHIHSSSPAVHGRQTNGERRLKSAVARLYAGLPKAHSAEQFGLDDLRELEHYIEGRFDEYGTFVGHIRAFGKDIGEATIPPSRAVRTG